MTCNFKHFTHNKCEFYPCHKDLVSINCLFCYCPLYTNDKCGGQFTLLNNGKKDCSQCTLPHTDYNYIIKKLTD